MTGAKLNHIAVPVIMIEPLTFLSNLQNGNVIYFFK